MVGNLSLSIICHHIIPILFKVAIFLSIGIPKLNELFEKLLERLCNMKQNILRI